MHLQPVVDLDAPHKDLLAHLHSREGILGAVNPFAGSTVRHGNVIGERTQVKPFLLDRCCELASTLPIYITTQSLCVPAHRVPKASIFERFNLSSLLVPCKDLQPCSAVGFGNALISHVPLRLSIGCEILLDRLSVFHVRVIPP